MVQLKIVMNSTQYKYKNHPKKYEFNSIAFELRDVMVLLSSSILFLFFWAED